MNEQNGKNEHFIQSLKLKKEEQENQVKQTLQEMQQLQVTFALSIYSLF